MDNTFLDFRLGKNSLNGFGDAPQIIHGKNPNILQIPAFQLVQNGQPVLCRFGLSDPQPQAFLLPVQFIQILDVALDVPGGHPFGIH